VNAVHDFQQQNAYSQKPADEAFWEAAYRAYFPDFLSMTPCIPDVNAQRTGVDRVIVLTNGREVRVDEKKRAQSYCDPDGNPDILLEFLSNDKTGAPGWMNKPLNVDFIAYALMDVRTVYMLPWDGLRRVWSRNAAYWKQKYGVKTAANDGYLTHSIPVPVPEIYRAISAACRVPVVQVVKTS
jgi:hypothetical protein